MHLRECLNLNLFSSVIDRNVFEMTEKIKSFRSECLKISANEPCYGEFYYYCETTDQNASAKKQYPSLNCVSIAFLYILNRCFSTFFEPRNIHCATPV